MSMCMVFSKSQKAHDWWVITALIFPCCPDLQMAPYLLINQRVHCAFMKAVTSPYKQADDKFGCRFQTKFIRDISHQVQLKWPWFVITKMSFVWTTNYERSYETHTKSRPIAYSNEDLSLASSVYTINGPEFCKYYHLHVVITLYNKVGWLLSIHNEVNTE